MIRPTMALLTIALAAACADVETSPVPAPSDATSSGETMVVELKRLDAVVPVDGTVTAREEAVLSTRVMAQITALEVEVGDHVRAGQVLVRLGTDDVSASRQRAEAALHVAQAARDEAARHAARMDTLLSQDAVAVVQRDQARLALVQAESQVTLAEAALREVDAASRYSLLAAPFDGGVVSRSARVGDLASPGVPLMALAADGPREVVLGVPVEAALHLEPGSEIVVRGAPGRAIARVRAVAPGADHRSRTIEVRAELPSSWPTGVSVTALVPTGTRDGIAIPESAVVQRGQLTGVRVIGDDGASLRWIRLGRRIESTDEEGGATVDVEVLSGLNVGERIQL
ncbi:MAG: efflux RND transporter periplasmic adaptor subunit [Gemmatimonadales bacterium]